jgi:hypothetical protein
VGIQLKKIIIIITNNKKKKKKKKQEQIGDLLDPNCRKQADYAGNTKTRS